MTMSKNFKVSYQKPPSASALQREAEYVLRKGEKGDPGVHVGPTPPEDTSLVWIDTTVPLTAWELPIPASSITVAPISGLSGTTLQQVLEEIAARLP